MALDTQDKRGSVIQIGMPFGRILPVPGGAIDADDRMYLAWLYSGFGAAIVEGPGVATLAHSLVGTATLGAANAHGAAITASLQGSAAVEVLVP